ncbi:MAG: hypothetical protein ABI550_07365 [Ignavibacteriaceae bacterium]
MKIIYLLIFLFSFLTSNVYAQAKPDLNNSKPTAYWKDKTSMFGILPNTKDEIIFLGDSINDRCEWNELFS